jgi:Xaa-Pro aminopeptidase
MSCPFHSDLYKRRRAAALDALVAQNPGRPDAIAILAAARVYTRNNDVEHDYRQDSDLFYLTGFDEPGSVLVLSAKDRKAIFFVRPRDPEREVWDGARAGVDGVKERFGADEAHPIGELAAELPKLMANVRSVYYRLGRDRGFDDKVIEAIDRTRARARSGVTWPTEVLDPALIVHEMRLFKAAEELDAMRAAAKITGEAHVRAMARAKPGMHEYEIEALLLETFRRHGSERAAYGSIVGSGVNATVLHYRANNRKMNSGELLLIDAGCELDYFASDVTRTFPISGAFTREQQAIYELVLEAQMTGIARAVKGTTLDAIHKETVQIITRGLVRLGLLAGDVDKLIEEKAFNPFYMHRTSHWLGMDVHDVGAYYVDGKPRELAPGMVFTVEPGIYIAEKNENVPPEWRGIGVRIEDDVLVTEGAPENLTAAIPKSVKELERACAA